jgi:2-haloacid dehalogenase
MVIVFDLNGTLLDTSPTTPLFRRIFGGKFSAEHWFTELLQHAMALTLAGEYRDFGDLAIAVLEMEATKRRVRLRAKDIQALRQRLLHLPAFPDVKGALGRLRKEGFRLAVLTNSSAHAADEQLRHAGLARYFERVFSVEAVQKYKPAPDPYRYAAQLMDVYTKDVLMVAAHHWDLIGAAQAGCRTAFIRRRGASLLPGWPAPDHSAQDLKQLARIVSAGQDALQPKCDACGNPALISIAGSLLALGGGVLLRRLRQNRPPAP